MALLRDSHSPVQKQPCNFLHLNWMYQPTSPCELYCAWVDQQVETRGMDVWLLWQLECAYLPHACVVPPVQ